MYAYGKIYQYNSKKEIELFLIYPKTKNFNKCERYFFNENLPNNLRLIITPFDLQNDELLARL